MGPDQRSLDYKVVRESGRVWSRGMALSCGAVGKGVCSALQAVGQQEEIWENRLLCR